MRNCTNSTARTILRSSRTTSAYNIVENVQHLRRPCNSSRTTNTNALRLFITAPIRHICLYCLTTPLGSRHHQRSNTSPSIAI
ncbi:hypothetical protein HBI33_016050 [Parastagonospora nodorum]|nr:hypothetical protein HBI33_016050 [Parastagonospora nodorum]